MVDQSARVDPFLKWAGRKSSLLEKILPLLPTGKRLIEPFVGSGAIFLNSNYPKYLLNDINQDLITLYKSIQTLGEEFIAYAKSFFTGAYNTEETYYKHRKRFNALDFSTERAALFVYMNRLGYSGLCRYNSTGGFNVPFGFYVSTPNFPEAAMLGFYQRCQNVDFVCKDFSEIIRSAKAGDVIYADPPYVPLTETANFTTYAKTPFGEEQHRLLAKLAEEAANRNVPVLISNHDTEFTRELYSNAELSCFKVRRAIGQKARYRNLAPELLALFC